MKCKRWVKTSLQGKFFEGMKNIQKCESINAYLNQFLRISLWLYEFVQQFDRAITRIRHNKAKTEFESNNSLPILSTKLTILENHFSSVYTKESFLKFHEEMKSAELFFMVGLISNDTFRSYTLSKFRHPNFKWEVQFWLNIMLAHDVWFNWHSLLPHVCCYESWTFGRDSYFMYFKEMDKVSKCTSKITTCEWDGKQHGLNCMIRLIDFYEQESSLTMLQNFQVHLWKRRMKLKD